MDKQAMIEDLKEGLKEARQHGFAAEEGSPARAYWNGYASAVGDFIACIQQGIYEKAEA